MEVENKWLMTWKEEGSEDLHIRIEPNDKNGLLLEVALKPCIEIYITQNEEKRLRAEKTLALRKAYEAFVKDGDGIEGRKQGKTAFCEIVGMLMSGNNIWEHLLTLKKLDEMLTKWRGYVYAQNIERVCNVLPAAAQSEFDKTVAWLGEIIRLGMRIDANGDGSFEAKRKFEAMLSVMKYHLVARDTSARDAAQWILANYDFVASHLREGLLGDHEGQIVFWRNKAQGYICVSVPREVFEGWQKYFEERVCLESVGIMPHGYVAQDGTAQDGEVYERVSLCETARQIREMVS